MNIITGEKFIKLSNYIFNIDGGEDYYNLSSTFDVEKIKDGDIVYTHTHNIKYLFDEIKKIDKKVKIISHNSDHRVKEFDIPDNIIKWYSQNVCFKHEKLESIPIGLENDLWFVKTFNKKDIFFNKMYDKKNHKNLLYVNHNINTNPKERQKPYQMFSDKKWCSIQNGRNGQNFNNYIDNLYNHKFVLCPEGNGTDTHRTWECLYLNTIPIEKRNINNQFYTELPICFVSEWEEITETFLEKEYTRIVNQKFNLEKLNFDYWKNKIKK